MDRNNGAGEEQAEHFTSETTDDCHDNARTELNREPPDNPEGAVENAEQKSLSDPAERPPVRDTGKGSQTES